MAGATNDDYIDIELSDLKERFSEFRQTATYGAQDYFNDLAALQEGGEAPPLPPFCRVTLGLTPVRRGGYYSRGGESG